MGGHFSCFVFCPTYSEAWNGLSQILLARYRVFSGVFGDCSSLIDDRFDHDSCGVGFVAAVDGSPDHQILQQALTALGRLAHRGATAADGKSSDGVGVFAAVPRNLLFGLPICRLMTVKFWGWDGADPQGRDSRGGVAGAVSAFSRFPGALLARCAGEVRSISVRWRSARCRRSGRCWWSMLRMRSRARWSAGFILRASSLNGRMSVGM